MLTDLMGTTKRFSCEREAQAFTPADSTQRWAGGPRRSKALSTCRPYDFSIQKIPKNLQKKKKVPGSEKKSLARSQKAELLKTKSMLQCFCVLATNNRKLNLFFFFFYREVPFM